MRNDSEAERPLLIDTHYWLWYAAGSPELSEADLSLIHAAAKSNNLLLSAISVWETAMLESKHRIQLPKPCVQWIDEALALPGISLVPLAPDIAIESSQLPGGFRLSLADRIIVATARVLGARFLTSNKSMRAYCKESHVLLA